MELGGGRREKGETGWGGVRYGEVVEGDGGAATEQTGSLSLQS